MHNGNGSADQSIVRLHREGRREESLRRFVEEYQSRLYLLSYRMLGNHDDAMDALQEILMHVDRSLPRFKGDSSLYTWAYRLGANVCLNLRRKIDPMNNHTELNTEMPDTVLMPVERPDENPDEMCKTRFKKYLVHRALLKLPETQRIVLVLHDLEEMSSPEVAGILGIDANAVKSRLHRARAMFKNTISEYFQTHGIEENDILSSDCTREYLTAAPGSESTRLST